MESPEAEEGDEDIGFGSCSEGDQLERFIGERIWWAMGGDIKFRTWRRGRGLYEYLNMRRVTE